MKFDDFTRALVLKAYLFEGKSHREIQREILHLPAPARGGGFHTMTILHEYGIKGEHKALLKSGSVSELNIDNSATILLEEFLKIEKEVDHLFENNLNPDGKSTESSSTIKTRLFQDRLRAKTIINYNHQCAICDIHQPNLLVCSHIVPWSSDENVRLDLQNSICLCFLHDKLFDKGYWTLSEDDEIILSDRVDFSLLAFFQNSKFKRPDKFGPNPKFLAFHRKEIFK